MNTLIKYDDLRKLEINENMDVSLLNFTTDTCKTIKITKIISNEDSQNFKIEMPKYCKWNSHFHDCEETIVMYEGILLNNSTNTKINRLEPLIIKPYTDHSIEAIEDSVFYVEFKKPQI